MKKYCDNCQKEVEAQVLVCFDCNEEFFCEELDSATLINAYNGYRRRHKLLKRAATLSGTQNIYIFSANLSSTF